MPHFIPLAQRNSADPPSWPTVRLELRCADGPATSFEFCQESIVVGSVPGCDIRLPGGEFPPLVAVLAPVGQELCIRKLAHQATSSIVGAVPKNTLKPGETIELGRFRLSLTLLAGKLSSVHAPAQPNVPSPPAAPPPPLPTDLAEARRRLDEDRRDWEQDAERQAEALALRSRQALEREKQLAAGFASLERDKTTVARERDKLAADRELLNSMETRLAAEREKLVADQRALVDLRSALYQRYRSRRDQLAALREAVDHAARKVQEEKRRQNEERLDLAQLRQTLTDEAARQTEVAAAQEREQSRLAEQHRLVEEWQRELEDEHRQQAETLAAERTRLAAESTALADAVRQHKEDLARLDRLHAALHQRQQDLDSREQQLRSWHEQLTRDAADLHEQTQQLPDWEKRLAAQAATLAADTETLEKRRLDLAAQAEQLAGQQTALAALWSRCEQAKAEMQRREVQHAEERLRLDQMEADLRRASRQLQIDAEQLDAERRAWVVERAEATARLERLAEDTARVRSREEAQHVRHTAWQQLQAQADERALELSQQTLLLTQRGQRLRQSRRRLLKLRRRLDEQLAQVARTEQTHATLQEQLRRRADYLAEQERALQAAQATLDTQKAEWASQQTHAAEQLQAMQEQYRQQAVDLAAREAALAQQTAEASERANQLAAAGAALTQREEALAAEAAGIEQRRLAVEAARQEVQEQTTALREGLPTMLAQARRALDQLGTARGQLRTHLQEIHAYAQQAQADLDAARAEIVDQAERVRQQLADHRRRQDAHRAEVAGFKQLLSEWESQLIQLRQQLSEGKEALAQQAAQLDEQRKQLAASSTELEQRSEELSDQERDVASRREEITRHLGDMQHWYRHKLRELADRKLLHPPAEFVDDTAPEPVVLSLAASRPKEPNAVLADWLGELELIEPATLAALLDEARQRGQSLREMLIEGEYLTAYQIELIEQGRLEALVVGSLRVIDRLRITPMETIYRVFDPRRGEEVLLRQLSPRADAAQVEDFRHRFAAAARVRHPNLAATLEVVNKEDAPAAVQEWVVGLPSTEWADLAAAPSVWLRLLQQAAAGLAAAHAAGLTHGRLHAGRLLLTEHGELKVCGVGEPGWLTGDVHTATPHADWQALGKIGDDWLHAGMRHRQGRPWPDWVIDIVKGLRSEAPVAPFNSAEGIVAHLTQQRAANPDDGTAWQRLLSFVQRRLNPDATPAQRQSA